MNKFFQILGLKPGASEAEIKDAYRRLAKKYHPDISKEPNAEEKFIEITEAYQLLLDGPAVFKQGLNFTEREEIIKSKEEIRGERAREFARMRYEKFKRNNEAFHKSWYYGPVKFGIYLLIFLSYSLAIGMFLAPVLAWVFTKESYLLIPMLIVSLFGLVVFKLARDLHKGVKPYLTNYR